MNIRKTINEKRKAAQVAIITAMTTLSVSPIFAAQTGATNFNKVVEPVVGLLNSLLGPLMAIVGAVGSLYCILLGVKYAKAEEPQDREKAKQHLKSAIIGFVLIFVLIVVLNLLMPVMETWVYDNAKVTM